MATEISFHHHKVTYLIIVITLLHCCTSISAAGHHANSTAGNQSSTLLHLRWKVMDDVLILNWKHNTSVREHFRYYVCIQEIETHSDSSHIIHSLSQIYYIPVKNYSTLTTQIRGLKPFTTYRAKAIAMSPMTTLVSNYVQASTRHLSFLKVHNLTVTSVTNISALLKWHYSMDIPTNMTFKLTCNGLLKYTQHSETIEEKVSFEHESRSSLKGVSQLVASTLYPNVHYTCHMQSVMGSKMSDTYSEIKFLTLPGRPPAPAKPEVITDKYAKTTLDSFVVKLYESSNKYGQISHYIVYAVPVKQPKGSPRSIPYTPTVPYSQLLTKSVTVHLASSVSTALPFMVNEYDQDKLPEKLSFNASYKDAFKRDMHYAFVVYVFSCKKDHNCSMYSMSLPNDPPVYIGKDDNDEWINTKKSRIKHMASAALYTVVTVVSILTGITLTILLVSCAHSKSRGINLKLLNFGRSNKSRDIEVGTSEEESLLYVKKISSRKLPPHKTKFRRKRFGSSSGGGGGLQLSSIIAKKNEHHSTRVDKVKLLDNTETEQDQELRLDLFSITTPPDSPCLKQKRPSSPLTTSHRSVHVHVPLSPSSDVTTIPSINNNKYVTSPVASQINQDVLTGSYTLPRSRPYVPPQRSFKARSRTNTPKMPDPLPPKVSKQSMKPQVPLPQETTEDKHVTIQILGNIEDNKFVDNLIEDI